jgi:Recombination endonuclease VII
MEKLTQQIKGGMNMPVFAWDSSNGAYTKTCSECRTTYIGAEDQEEAEKIFFQYFTHNSKKRDGFHNSCRECSNGRAKGYKLITPKAEMLAAQGSECAICSTPLSLDGVEGTLKAEVDHDWDTGEVRQLLCRTCNCGVAYIDKVEWRTKAIAYHNFHKSHGDPTAPLAAVGAEGFSSRTYRRA